MGDKDDIYLTIQIKRSDVEARFAATGTPASPRSIEIIGEVLREANTEGMKEDLLTALLSVIKQDARESLNKKGN